MNGELCDCDNLLGDDAHSQHYDNCRLRLMKRETAAEYITNYPKDEDGCLALQNSNVVRDKPDVLYHLALSTDDDISSHFGGIKFVCMGGTEERMQKFAEYVSSLLDIPASCNLTAASHRYALYRIGPVLSVSHGIGIPSMTTVLQEVLKLLFHARCRDPVVFRIGTSGGLGVEPGTVVVSTFGLNGMLEKTYDLPVLGKMTRRPSVLDSRLAREVRSMSSSDDGFDTINGGTLAADDFYLGQARTDGPICHHTEEDKFKFLRTLQGLGVKNIEMEVTAFAALTHQCGVRAADVCVTIIDRMKGDQVTVPKSTTLEYQKRPMVIVGRFIKRALLKKRK